MRAAALATAAAVTAVAGLAGEASASELIDRNAARPSLSVNGAGHALVTYRRGGGIRRVHAWGAVNARPPTRGVPQVSFRLNYSGRGFSGGTCLGYDGPPLAWLVRACKAPDGSYWALQSWQRLRANSGGVSGPWELRLSHWTGELARLQIGTDWAYRRFDHLYGLFTYQGKGVFGFRTTRAGAPLDGYGRNVYVDTLGSRYGAGWRRENSFVSQRPNGSFCYGFYPRGGRTAGKGTQYRATVIGPGVTPDVMWQGPAPGSYDATRERDANAQQRQLFAGNRTCRPL